MKTEELTALGLNDEQVKGVFKLHGTAITALQNELGAANNTIKGLRDAAKKFEGVDVDKLRGDLEALQNKYDADVGAARLSGALDAAAAVSSSCVWDRITCSPPLLLQTIYHLHETETTPFL